MLRYSSNLFMFLPLAHIIDNISSVNVSHVSYRSCFERRLPSNWASSAGYQILAQQVNLVPKASIHGNTGHTAVQTVYYITGGT